MRGPGTGARFLILLSAEFATAREAAENEFSKNSDLVLKRGNALAKPFNELVATRVPHIFDIAQHETTPWVRGLYKAIERSLAEARSRLEHTVASIEKVKSAELDLAERIAALQDNLDVIEVKHSALAEARGLWPLTGVEVIMSMVAFTRPVWPEA